MLLELLILLICPLITKPDPLPYAEWAHYHMVWLSNSHSNQVDIQNMFNDYTNNNIKFGIVNIDSRWATGFNTFIFNSTNFPTIRDMLDDFRAKDKHIVLWMTSFVNTDSPTFTYAQEHGFLFNKTIKWWHGEGRLLNYFDVNALDWWHSQIERLINTVGPIHAFKVLKSYFFEKIILLFFFLKGRWQ
jgi:alpha-D-xyloside xylohydrolase